MPDNVSFRLVKEKGSEVTKWYPFWIGTIVGFVFVFLAFLVAVVDITRANRLHSSFLDFSDMLFSGKMIRSQRTQMGMQKVFITAPLANAFVSGKTQIAASVSSQNLWAVKFLLDGSEIAAFSAGPYVYAWDTKEAKNGDHVIAVLAVDATGYATLTQQRVVVAN